MPPDLGPEGTARFVWRRWRQDLSPRATACRPVSSLPVPDRCPFCHPDRDRVFHEGDLTLGVWDAFPASEGHALLITRRHVPTWFDATDEERAELVAGIEIARARILETHSPDGFNIGVNAGEAAGQTVMHLHVHVIPRYAGDVPDPRGGVRHVIPARGNYLLADAAPPNATAPRTDAAPPLRTAEATVPYLRTLDAAIFGLAPHRQSLVTGGEADPLLPHLLAHMNRSDALDVAVAFVMGRGVAEVERHLVDLLERGGRVRLLTGDYLGATDPDALLALLDLADEYPAELAVRVYEARARSFHPKTYILRRGGRAGVAFVGSSNLSHAALSLGVEWNYRVVSHEDRAGFAAVCAAFERLFDDEAGVPLDAAWIERYRARRPALRPALQQADDAGEPLEVEDEPLGPALPDEVQREALDALADTRADGNAAGLVVLATGMGKTFLGAFDSAEFSRVLFVAHREEILKQARRTFRRVRPRASLGFYHGGEKSPGADILFASVQTLGQPAHLEAFAPDAFDYLIVDEFHHAHADTYRRLLEHFEPRFLLGLTATPERTDGGDLLALCGENVVYRADLFEGIERGRLCPFDYFGVPDPVEYDNIPWRRLTDDELTGLVATEARAENAYEQLRVRGGRRTLAFCVSIRHAEFMRRFFSERGLRAVAVHSGPESAPRQEAIQLLEKGELDVVVTVDMFNEGVDIPAVDTVLMLRPTDSKVVWLQQLGRGLRKRPGKRLSVIDYVGNHRAFLRHLQTLFGLDGSVLNARRCIAGLREAGGRSELPGGCSVTYDLEALELLDQVARVPRKADAFRAWLDDFRERNERRPRAVEAFHEGFDPQQLPPALRPWFAGLRELGALSAEEAAVAGAAPELFELLQTTAMTRSYKMVLLLSWIASGRFPSPIGLDELGRAFSRLALRTGPLALDVSVDLRDARAVERLVRDNPVKAWVATGLFAFDGALSLSAEAPDSSDVFTDMLRELAEWRLAQYLHRRRQDRIEAVFDDEGSELDAHFTTERSEGGYAVIVESRGGTAGSRAARNTQYGEGLALLLRRLAVLGATLQRAELWTRSVSGERLELRGRSYPLALAEIDDIDQLRRDIQAAQGNNPTRRIRLSVSGVAEESLVRVHRGLSRGA